EEDDEPGGHEGGAMISVITWLVALLFAQQTPTRESMARPAGAAIIAGTVVGDDASKPLRKVVVTLAGGGFPAAQEAVTDDTVRSAGNARGDPVGPAGNSASVIKWIECVAVRSWSHGALIRIARGGSHGPIRVCVLPGNRGPGGCEHHHAGCW